ncbi:DUF397 domain-containing protein [Streptomonospora litoralis]|uniref:DUF397 domain-containing protein n=1 Tax=Streptomonospora litoralis TaxID=2498135 RepID=A0A4P6Q488_9ACTN|nr:DUF397 domain-containing protein [Streptomonospora litoralis]QBI55518.1 hypothetical protein EKD16_18775 [Streptomonospora litoralis]
MQEAGVWQKSSYSGGNAGNCVEAAWLKSSYSGPNGGDCVEVAPSAEHVKIRDTRNRRAGHLTLPADEWAALLADLKGDRL